MRFESRFEKTRIPKSPAFFFFFYCAGEIRTCSGTFSHKKKTRWPSIQSAPLLPSASATRSKDRSREAVIVRISSQARLWNGGETRNVSVCMLDDCKRIRK